MAWPQTAIALDEPVTTVALNSLPTRIANSTLSADAANIDFTSIPGHYAHLMLECYLRGSFVGTSVNIGVRFNNDTAGNYDWQTLVGTGATPGAIEQFAQTEMMPLQIPASTAPANLFGGGVVSIPHYTNAANNKVIVSRGAIKRGIASGDMGALLRAGFWQSNVAINQVTIFPLADNFVTGSRVTLIGFP